MSGSVNCIVIVTIYVFWSSENYSFPVINIEGEPIAPPGCGTQERLKNYLLPNRNPRENKQIFVNGGLQAPNCPCLCEGEEQKKTVIKDQFSRLSSDGRQPNK